MSQTFAKANNAVCIHLFIQAFDKCVLRNYEVPGTSPGLIIWCHNAQNRVTCLCHGAYSVQTINETI